MKKIILFLAIMALFASSCKKNEVVSQDAIDRVKINNYLEQNSLSATEHPSGLYYIIQEAGNENHPDINATVTVSYDGKLLDGSRFDRGEFFTSPLYDLIKGWQLGIPLIGEGGSIKLFIPSSLAYGGQSTASIPANSVLIFDVSLHYFSN